ncbi:MAG: M20/M25/M40 family metallo-hydrolase [Spirochaetales bacterium]|jgi:carboxypeptidase PM20D1|nr:M20/M25/M40 family metallo-hydrolase [Spirochaetales bacterium]
MIYGAAGLVIFLVVLVLARTFAFKPPVRPSRTQALDPGPCSPDALERLAGAVRIPTVCNLNYSLTDFGPFDNFVAYLKESFPLFHKTCELTRINTYGLIYRWKGSNPGLKPMLLTAHYDVVPAEGQWKHPPFSGAQAEGKIWGRGTLDIKSQLTAHLEAAEDLMRSGFVPPRDFYFVYGQDEEIGGANGAVKMAEYLEAQGIRLEGVLDEGGIAALDVIRGVSFPLALVGIGEKGFCNYRWTLKGSGGHSSMPPAHTALGRAASLICRIEANPARARLIGPTRALLASVAGEMGFAVRMAVANLWLFKPLLLKILSKNPTTNALIRTTFAATMARGSSAPNVLPQEAEIIINARLLPGETVDSTADYLSGLARDEQFSLEKNTPSEPSPISPDSSPLFLYLKNIIAEVYPNVLTTPYLVVGATDSRHYYRVCDNVYRFTPMLLSNAEKNTMHNVDEAISIENYGRMIHFYKIFIREFYA